MMHGEAGKMCPCPHHKAPGLLLFLLGLAFLLKAFDALSAEAVDVIWPVLVMAAGLMKMAGGSCKCC